MNISRIPDYSDKTFDGMLIWFATLSERDIVFHPDDKPEDVISSETGEKLFSQNEIEVLNGIMNEMFELHGDNVYEAAYPIFMKKMGIQMDA